MTGIGPYAVVVFGERFVFMQCMIAHAQTLGKAGEWASLNHYVGLNKERKGF